MKKGLIKRLVLLILLCSFVIWGLYKITKPRIEQRRVTKSIAYGLDMPSEKEITKFLKETKSDIKGKTLYDKYKMGLYTEEGSDSDFDGLTDKEEIEVYGTDPLKSSTSGDLYSDSYKVEHNMDLFKEYEYKEEILFPNSEVDFVSLEAKTPTDFSAVTKDATSWFSFEEYGIEKVYKGLLIYNFSGELSIDVADYLPSGSGEDLFTVLVFNGELRYDTTITPDRADFEIKNKLLTVDYEFNTADIYYVYLVDKTSTKTNIVNFVKDKTAGLSVTPKYMASFMGYADIGSSSGYGDNDNAKVMMCGSGLIDLAKGLAKDTDFTIYYPEDASQKALESAMRCFKERVHDKDITDIKSHMKKISVAEFKAKEALYKYTPLRLFYFANMNDEEVFNVPDVLRGFVYIIHIHDPLSDEQTNDPSYIEEEKKKNEDQELNKDVWHYNVDSRDKKQYGHYHTNFNIRFDEFQFQNFMSSYSENGNCAGISHLTTFLYNKGYFPSSGEFVDPKGELPTIKWDISKYPENKTLTDKDLYDYKAWDFIDNNSDRESNVLINDYLSEGELEFIKMIAALQFESNRKVRMADYYSLGPMNPYNSSWSAIEKVIEMLNNDKIVECGLSFNDDAYFSHEVVLFDYTYFESTDTYAFRVYDSNIPLDEIEKKPLTDNGQAILWVTQHISPDGTKYFTYSYKPFATNDYSASNYCKHNAIAFWDEDYNIISPMINPANN